MKKHNVVLVGTAPMLMDRYAGNNKEQLEWRNKAYQEDGKLVLPSTNLMSFLSAENTESAPKRLMGKSWRSIAKAAQSFVSINPFNIPIMRGKKQLTPEDLVLHFAVARLKGGIPNPKERPMIELPWQIEFELNLIETPDLSDSILKKLFEEGGVTIGIGTWRGSYGKFGLEKW
jgi:hypothetical protein